MPPLDQQANYRYLGVDSGGSKTIAVIVDAEGRELGRGVAGGSNHNNSGVAVAIRNIMHAVEQAAQAAGSQLPLHKAWLGISGLDRPADHALLSPYLQHLAERVHLSNDGELGLSALENAVGIAIIAGTGSIVLGRDAHGTQRRAGGWGYLLGDEGSGYYIAHEALIAALRAADGRGQPTNLLDLVLQYWNLSSYNDIVGQVYVEESKAKVARLSSLVLQAARQDDAVAVQIVEQAARELALAVTVVTAQLDLARVPLALAGSLLVHEADYRERVLASLRETCDLGQIEIVSDPGLSAARATINLPIA